MQHRFALAIVPMLALAFAAPVRAADSAAQARELFQKGQHQLDQGKSKEAIATFESAYKAGKAPSLLFYLGEAYRQSGQNAKAIEEYQLYLEKVPNAPKKAEAEAHIAALKKAPAVEAPKRKMELADLDLGSKPAPAAAKPKKMELDDVELTGPSAAAAAAATKADKRAAAKARRAARKDGASERAAAAQAAADAKSAADARAAADATAAANAIADAKMAADARTAAAARAAASAVPSSTSAQIDLLVNPAGTASPAPGATGLAAIDLEGPASAPPAPIPPPAAPPAPKIVASNSVPHDTSAHRAAPPPLQTTAPNPALFPRGSPDRSDGSGLRTTGIIVGSVGVAALITGGLFGLGAMTASNDVNDAAAAGKPYDPGVQSRGQRDQKLETAFLIGGGAAVVGGVLLFVLAPPGNDRMAAGEKSTAGEATRSDDRAALALDYAGLVPMPGGLSAAASLRF